MPARPACPVCPPIFKIAVEPRTADCCAHESVCTCCDSILLCGEPSRNSVLEIGIGEMLTHLYGSNLFGARHVFDDCFAECQLVSVLRWPASSMRADEKRFISSSVLTPSLFNGETRTSSGMETHGQGGHSGCGQGFAPRAKLSLLGADGVDAKQHGRKQLNIAGQ